MKFQMVNASFALLVLSALSSSQGVAFEHEGPGHGSGERAAPARHISHPIAKATANFPKYPSHESVGNHGAIHQVPAHPDALGNHVTSDHLQRIDFAHERSEGLMRNDVRVTNVVRLNRARFTNFYRPEFEHRTVFYNNFITRYNAIVVAHPPYLDIWHHHGFFGGLYWGFHPIVDIDTYFYNPMVYWFYVGTFDDYYYRNWYQSEYDAYPELHKPFQYHGLYYPTENLKQLLFGVSAMSAEKQAHFRSAASDFTKKLAQGMANGLGQHVKLANGDIAVTHYEVLGYDNALVLEGVVTYNGQGYNFKGLLDLEHPEATSVFVPATWDKNPNPEQLAKLDELNHRINQIKGVPDTEVTAEPEPAMAPPTSGEVTAEPEPQH